MLRSNLCDFSDGYTIVKGTITFIGVGDNAAARQADERNKGVISKNCAAVTGNTFADGNTKDAEIIVPLKYLRNFWRTLKMPLINCEGISN